MYTVVARSTFASQCLKIRVSDHFWTLRCRKSARRCGAKHVRKSKVLKTVSLGPLLDVQMSKKWTLTLTLALTLLLPLQVQLQLQQLDATTTRRRRTRTRTTPQLQLQLHLQLRYFTLQLLHYTNYTTPITLHLLHYRALQLQLHFTTLHYTCTTLHCTALRCTTLHYNYNSNCKYHYHYCYTYNYTTSTLRLQLKLWNTTLQLQLQAHYNYNYTTLHLAGVHPMTTANTPKSITPTTFRSISGFALPSMHGNNSTLL